MTFSVSSILVEWKSDAQLPHLYTNISGHKAFYA
jgi:hypothetical protein